MTMTPMIESFVRHFGEMGSKWGFNRTVGQIYALLVMNEKPLPAVDIAEALSISRGNVSMAIKELQSWQLINIQHYAGDRKEYFSAAGSIWDMAAKVFEERHKREVDPTLSLLRGVIMDTPVNDQDAYAQEQMKEIHDLLENVTLWCSELQRMDQERLTTLMKLGSSVGKVLDIKDKLLSSGSSNQ